jgi:hypothetical protein
MELVNAIEGFATTLGTSFDVIVKLPFLIVSGMLFSYFIYSVWNR